MGLPVTACTSECFQSLTQIFAASDTEKTPVEQEKLNRFSVTERWLDQTLSLPLRALRVHLQYPFGDEPAPENLLNRLLQSPSDFPLASDETSFSVTHLDSLLPKLLDMVLAGETGERSLVSPQPIGVDKLRAMLGVGGKNGAGNAEHNGKSNGGLKEAEVREGRREDILANQLNLRMHGS